MLVESLMKKINQTEYIRDDIVRYCPIAVLDQWTLSSGQIAQLVEACRGKLQDLKTIFLVEPRESARVYGLIRSLSLFTVSGRDFEHYY